MGESKISHNSIFSWLKLLYLKSYNDLEKRNNNFLFSFLTIAGT